ncbi:MAG: MlaD family protein [Solirubrobacteraceae bacterium]
MQTKVTSWSHVLIPVAFALACVVIALAIWRSFGGTVPLQAAGYRVTVDVPQANSVFANTAVRIAGVDVGRVTQAERHGRRARLELEIEPRFAPLHAGARALVRTKTLLGEAYVEIAPGSRRAPRIDEGGRLRQDASTPTQQRLDDVLSTFDPRTRRHVRELFDGVSTAFAGRAGDLNDVVGRARPVTADLGTVLETLDSQTVRLRRLIGDAATVFGALGSRAGAVERLVRDGDRFLAVTARQHRDVRATIDGLPPFVATLRTSSQELIRTSDDLDGAVRTLRRIAPQVDPALRALNDGMPPFSELFEAFLPALRAGRTGLPALTEIAERALPRIDPIYLGVRQLLPVLQLIAADRRSVVGALSNMAAATNGVDASNNDRPNAGEFQLSVWNEIVGGWTKRLPTNRANPYPQPGSTERAMLTGGLRSYDCRNVHNPLLLPAIGSGAPDCREQGPYEFQGRRAYYPRLHLPAP